MKIIALPKLTINFDNVVSICLYTDDVNYIHISYSTINLGEEYCNTGMKVLPEFNLKAFEYLLNHNFRESLRSKESEVNIEQIIKCTNEQFKARQDDRS